MGDLAVFKAKTRELLLEGERTGLLESQDCIRRLQTLDQTSDVEEIEALVQDLVEEVPAQPGEPSRLTMLADSSSNLSVIMGEQRFWPSQLSRNLHCRCIMGSAVLDYRQAQFPPEESLLEVKVIMGELEILLPPGVEVLNQVSVVMGDTRNPSPRPLREGGPRIVLTGKVVMGSLRIREGAPGTLLSL